MASRLVSRRSLLSRSLRMLPAVTPPAVPVRFYSKISKIVLLSRPGDEKTVSVTLENEDSSAGILPRITFVLPMEESKVTHHPIEPKIKVLDEAVVRDVWETTGGLYLWLDMPGVDKENVKVRVEKDVLVMEGEGQKGLEDDKDGQSYNYRIQLLEVNLFNTNDVQSAIVNDVLNVFVPKFKLEERPGVVMVPVH
ncbi:hypothetical protein CASFOL_039686 [Castilleja foliolosa]|uniref:SHSP domain-containing protein n=1 Tax=Castilleja foliolosa TaxID=1961234 RepID=A0ABD3BFW1_9LAMI